MDGNGMMHALPQVQNMFETEGLRWQQLRPFPGAMGPMAPMGAPMGAPAADQVGSTGQGARWS